MAGKRVVELEGRRWKWGQVLRSCDIRWPNNAVELPAHSVAVFANPQLCFLWAAAHRRRYAHCMEVDSWMVSKVDLVGSTLDERMSCRAQAYE